jgi:hypothetical protein
MNEKYVRSLETENERLRAMLHNYDLIKDIINSQVDVKRTDFWGKIDPYDMAAFLEKHGWKMQYEKKHERYVSRKYVSRKGDRSIKLHMKDDSPDSSRRSDIGSKIKNAIETYSKLHNKGILLIIFEVLKQEE